MDKELEQELFPPLEPEFFVPAQEGYFELVEKKSRFIGQIWHVKQHYEVRDHLQATRKKYHDARHHCTSYHLDIMQSSYSDDGEPHGTAGLPIHMMFSKENLQQYFCVVTRYFGGTKLGTGGLVRAYTQAAKGALEQAGRATYQWLDLYLLICPYHLLDPIQRMLPDVGATVAHADYGEQVRLTVKMPIDKVDNFLHLVEETTAGQVVPVFSLRVSDLVVLGDTI